MNGGAGSVRIRAYRGFNSGLVMSLTLFALALFGVVWVYMGMTTIDQWPIRWLEVDGSFERVSAEQMRAGLAPQVMGSFFTVDLEAVSEAAFRQAWVSGVTVQKNWPDTVRVRITEYDPVAHWTLGRLVSREGRSFEVPGADQIQGLPWLEGPGGQLEVVVGAWQQFNNELLPAGLEIDRIRLDRRGAWFLVLTNGTEIHIGRADALPRLHRLVSSWPNLMSGRDLAPLGVDLRYSNGYAVRWPEYKETYGKES